jgi:hypothetical protein
MKTINAKNKTYIDFKSKVNRIAKRRGYEHLDIVLDKGHSIQRNCVIYLGAGYYYWLWQARLDYIIRHPKEAIRNFKERLALYEKIWEIEQAIRDFKRTYEKYDLDFEETSNTDIRIFAHCVRNLSFTPIYEGNKWFLASQVDAKERILTALHRMYKIPYKT